MPWHLVCAEVTPRLKWLTIHNFHADLLDIVEGPDIFGEDDTRKIQVCIGSRYILTAEEREIAAFTKRASPCIVGLGQHERGFGVHPAMLSLTWMPALTYLGLPASFEAAVPSVIPGVVSEINSQTVKVMKQFVSDMPSLQVLQFGARWQRNEGEHGTLLPIWQDMLMDALTQIVGSSSGLRYIKVGYMSWSVLPRSVASGSSRLVALDRWETAVEEPAWIWRGHESGSSRLF